MRLHPLPALLAHLAGQARRLQDLDYLGGECARVGVLDEEPFLAIGYLGWDAPDPRGHDRLSLRHRLEYGLARTLEGGRQDEDTRRRRSACIFSSKSYIGPRKWMCEPTPSLARPRLERFAVSGLVGTDEDERSIGKLLQD